MKVKVLLVAIRFMAQLSIEVVIDGFVYYGIHIGFFCCIVCVSEYVNVIEAI